MYGLFYFLLFFVLKDENWEMGSPNEGLRTYELMRDTNENDSDLVF